MPSCKNGQARGCPARYGPDMNDMPKMTEGSRTLLARTLWRIETGLDRPLSLAALAAEERVTPFHLSRAFSLALGTSLMAYVKARRLTEAARALRATDARIIEIALGSGYDSHEGFSRSFRDHFGISPTEWRSAPDTQLTLQEATLMPTTDLPKVTPRIEKRPELRLAGMSRRFTLETRARIPALWEEVAAELGHVMRGHVSFGVCYDFGEEGFRYLAGFVDDGRIDTERLDHVVLPAGNYAVFDHAGHISTIDGTWTAIFEDWMPNSDMAPGEGPEFELYAVDFDPATAGGVSVCIPVQPKS